VVTSTEKSVLTRVDPKTNLVAETIAVGKNPRFLAVGEGSVWTLNQGDGSISRVDAEDQQGRGDDRSRLDGRRRRDRVGEGSVWVTLFKFPITRIDPRTNKVAQQFTGRGGDSIRVGHGSVLALEPARAQRLALDPKRIEATRRD
jgi:streptogramin lyase